MLMRHMTIDCLLLIGFDNQNTLIDRFKLSLSIDSFDLIGYTYQDYYN